MVRGAWTSGRMGVAQLTPLLALMSTPRAQAVWLGRLDPCSRQLLGPWYVLAVASREKGFTLEKDTGNVEGLLVLLAPDGMLKLPSSPHGLEGCSQSIVELQRQDSGWMFQNPSLGLLEYRVLGTNFRDYAIIFTQLEFGEEAFNTVELYSWTEMAREEAMRVFSKWSSGLGFWSQQQAQLQRDCECPEVLMPRAVMGLGPRMAWQEAAAYAQARPPLPGLWLLLA
ncbi:epididymal-specific lipocalin-6 [Heterocephalus glaber]|uniref:Epididymal-specific lipocalin-6 n=1 Tax=Heterocephalus glaber TaxID=10181 RepID=A0AAX6T6P9_HETGA|nr:epididymal-specific lipocalin-6 [Heterocephalus glaber]